MEMYLLLILARRVCWKFGMSEREVDLNEGEIRWKDMSWGRQRRIIRWRHEKGLKTLERSRHYHRVFIVFILYIAYCSTWSMLGEFLIIIEGLNSTFSFSIRGKFQFFLPGVAKIDLGFEIWHSTLTELCKESRNKFCVSEIWDTDWLLFICNFT